MSDLSAPASPALETTHTEPVHPERAGADWEADAALIEAVGVEFDQVEAALRRLDTPGAGRCEACGAAISREDLMADPLATRCPAHAA